MTDWQPSGKIEILKKRARILQKIRVFFLQRQVWEVETPLLSRGGNPDPNIESFTFNPPGEQQAYLHTSPEFPMKRLLAAGSGSIYQICKVFRAAETGRYHNPEFTILEWYRSGYDYQQLMDEVEAFLAEILADDLNLEESLRLTYRDAFLQYAGIDPFTTDKKVLYSCISGAGIKVEGMNNATPDCWLDLIMTHIVEPALPANRAVFIYDFPRSQASLARIRNGDPPVAERFEVYLNSIELANGFSELTDAKQQRHRFEAENNQRQHNGQKKIHLDKYFLAALQSGLPECAGVALGVDRLVMLATRAGSVDEVISFDFSRS